MPKIKSSLVNFSGTMDDLVYVNSRRYTSHTRKRAKAGSKKNEPVLKQNYKRTAFLNQLASDINGVVGSNSEAHKPSSFYFELQKRFRSQPVNNRFLLLSTLEGMDVHPRYTLGRLKGHHEITTGFTKQKINFHVAVNAHPVEQRQTNCYSFELLLLTWSKSSRSARSQRQLSEWVYLRDARPVFEFSFDRPAKTVHWILCLKQKMGWNGSPASLKAQGMRIVAVGTFDKKEELLRKKTVAKQASMRTEKSTFEPPRVKPKRLV